MIASNAFIAMLVGFTMGMVLTGYLVLQFVGLSITAQNDNPYSQANFPCHEDEVLGFSIRDSSSTMCYHIDELDLLLK